MAQAAPKQHRARAQSGHGGVAVGGPIADMQRTIEDRMTVSDLHPGTLVPADAGIAHRVSRLAGPVLLAAAYAGAALWWF